MEGRVTTWTTEKILAAAAEWVWIPPEAKQVKTSEYQLIAYPEYFGEPTQVKWSATARPVGELIGEVAGQVRAWGRDRVYWWIQRDTEPADTEETLRARGAVVAETVEVLAFDLSKGEPDLGLGARAERPRAELVRDEATMRASYLISAEVWDEHPERSDADIADDVARAVAELDEGSGVQVVAYLDGQPAATGGCTIAREVARLWGAGTRPQFRGRGAYRAVLARRIEVARRCGATLALVKGRVETSGPILAKAGFVSYGQERCYRLEVR